LARCTMKRYADLHHNECQYGAEEGLFCGEQTVGKCPYCEKHKNICYKPIKRIDYRRLYTYLCKEREPEPLDLDIWTLNTWTQD